MAAAANNTLAGDWVPYDKVQDLGPGEPWSGIEQRRAFGLLRDLVEAVSAGGHAVDVLRMRPGENLGSLFNLAVEHTHARENQQLCAEVRDVLLDDTYTRRLPTQRLRTFLDTFIVRTRPAAGGGGGGGTPTGRLPFFVHHGNLDWSWFVRDVAGNQDAWYSVKMLFDLGEMDSQLLPLLHPPPHVPYAAAVVEWGSLGWEEMRLQEELHGLHRLAAYLFGLERQQRREGEGAADDDDDDNDEHTPGGTHTQSNRVLEEAILRVLRAINQSRRRGMERVEDRVLENPLFGASDRLVVTHGWG